MRKEFRLPDPGEGLTEADIVTWLVAPGDTVEVNQAILEIETAKSLVELPCPWEGTVLELLAVEGSTVEVGTPVLAVEVADGEGSPSADGPAEQPVAAAQPSEAQAEDAAGANLVGYGERPAGEGGRRRISRPGAAPASPHGLALSTGEGGAQPPRSANGVWANGVSANGGTRPSSPSPARPTAGSPARPEWSPQADVAQRSSRVLAKPPVRKLAKDMGIDLGAVLPTGPGGLITREDVLGFVSETRADAVALYPGDDPWLVGGAVSADGRQTRVSVRSVRKRTAEAMVASAFTAPHVSVTHTVDMTRTMDLLGRLKETREFRDLRLTPMLFVMKALLIAVDRHPEINASWISETREIVYKHYVNLGIAASTPRGLLVPNIKDAHRLTLKELARELQRLTQEARAGKTSVADMADGTITISNVGAFGIDTGTPILNPGESAILAFGAVREMPWVRDGQIAVAKTATFTLSFDHRLVDGELGARVLADVCAVLEDPGQAMVWS